MLRKIFKAVNKYWFSNTTKRIPFQELKTKPITSFDEAFDLFEGAYEIKHKISHKELTTLVDKTSKLLFKSAPNYKYIQLYIYLSRLNLLDNFHRKVFADKIIGSLAQLKDMMLVRALYFLITYCPYSDLTVIQDYSLRLMELSQNIKQRTFSEYLFGLKTDFILSYAGLQTPSRKFPDNTQIEQVGQILALPHCISTLSAIDQATFDRVQKLLYVFLDKEISLYITAQTKPNQVDDRVFYETTYQDLALLYEIEGKLQFQTQLQEKINSIFHRKMHESQIDFISSVRILKRIMSVNHSPSFASITKMILDVIWGMENDELVNVPIKAILDFLNILKQGSYKMGFLKKFQKIIVKVDMYEEDVEEVKKLYGQLNIGEEMRRLIENN